MKKTTILIILFLSLFISSLHAAQRTDTKWLNYGLKLYNNGNFEKSIVAFEKAIYANPDNYLAFKNSGKVYLEMGDKRSSLDYYRRSYDLKPDPALVPIMDDLYYGIYGLGALSLYPYTFDITLHGNYTMYLGQDGLGMFSAAFNFGGSATVMYHFNKYFAAKSGLMLVNQGSSTGYNVSYLDIPIAGVLKFDNPFMNSSSLALSLGGYFGIKLSGTFGYDLLDDTGIPSSDFGIHGSLLNYLMLDKIAIITGTTIQYSLVDIYTDVPINALNIIISAGVAF